jgi:hypothetical protein
MAGRGRGWGAGKASMQAMAWATERTREKAACAVSHADGVEEGQGSRVECLRPRSEAGQAIRAMRLTAVLVHRMATRCYEESSCVEDGGRGIDTMVEHEISGKAEAQVRCNLLLRARSP